MKNLIKTLVVLALAIIANTSYCQTLENYFEAKGVSSVCDAAHPSNDYLEGTYDVHQGYVDLFITSRDNFFGRKVTTDIRLIRGAGNSYFSNILVSNDEDCCTFEAVKMEGDLLIAFLNALDKETYDKMRKAMIGNFNTDFENWTGKQWALLAINLDYYKYLSSGN